MAPACRAALVSVSSSIADKPEMNKEGGAFPMFNYAARKLEASVRSDPALAAVDVDVFDFQTKDIEHICTTILDTEPDVVGMSVYVWSLPLLVEVARRIKAARPGTWIILGGPSSRPAMLNQGPMLPFAEYLDAIAVGDGEEIIRAVLAARLRGDALPHVDGLSFFDGHSWNEVTRVAINDLEIYGSVYQQKGVMPHGSFAFLESFRGCPLSCAFCQWGEVSDNAKRIFSAEYLIEEFKAIKALGSTGAFLLDAALNLNPRAFRNLVAAEEETSMLRDMQLAFELYPTHLQDQHMDFLRRINPAHIGIGVQTLDLGVLKSLDRPFKLKRLRSIIEQLADMGQVNLEIILGLPGDSPESFRATLAQMRKFPCYIRVYHCLVLPDALMTRPPADAQIQFDPETLLLTSCRGWSREDLRRTAEYVASISVTPEFNYNLHDSWWLIPPDETHLRQGRLAPSSVREPSIRRERETQRERLDDQRAAEARKERRAQEEAKEVHEANKHAAPPEPPRPSEAEIGVLAAQLQRLSSWTLQRVSAHGAGCVVVALLPSGELRLLVEPSETAGRSFRAAGGVAVSYTSREPALDSAEVVMLGRVIDDCAPAFLHVLRGFQPAASAAVALS